MRLRLLIHRGRVTHICVSKLTITGSDNGLSPGRRQAIIWTNTGILLIWPLGTNFIEILIGIHTFSLTKMHLNVSVCRMATILSRPQCVNTLRPRQNVHRLADDTFKRIFLNENVWKSIKISLKFVPKGPINNIPALVQIMAWRRSGDKPLSEPMMVSLLTHICVTRPQCVKEVRSLSCCRYFYERCLVWMCYCVVIYRWVHYFVAFSLWIVVSSFTQPIIWCNQGSVTI